MEFVCPDPKALVRAANVKATLDAFQLVPSMGRRLVEKHDLQIANLTPDRMILVQNWLNALKEIQETVGGMVVRKVGLSIVENADIPPTFKNAEDMLMVANDLYLMNHKGNVGKYLITRQQDGSIEVRCETPYPRMFEWGVIEGFTRNKRFGFTQKYVVDFTEGAPNSDVTCVINVRRVKI